MSADALAADTLAAVAALRRGDWEVARGHLEGWLDHPDWDGADDLVDVHARLWSLYAQALVGLDRVDDALTAARRAKALVPQDADAARAIASITAAARARSGAAEAERRSRIEAERLVATPIEELLVRVFDADDRADVRLAKASALLGVGRTEEARGLYQQNLIGRVSTKTAVLSRIGLAHCDREDAARWLAEAWEIADHEPQLYAAVTFAAQALGLPTPTMMGPSGLALTTPGRP